VLKWGLLISTLVLTAAFLVLAVGLLTRAEPEPHLPIGWHYSYTNTVWYGGQMLESPSGDDCCRPLTYTVGHASVDSYIFDSGAFIEIENIKSIEYDTNGSGYHVYTKDGKQFIVSKDDALNLSQLRALTPAWLYPTPSDMDKGRKPPNAGTILR
jgi:hypothetical protein